MTLQDIVISIVNFLTYPTWHLVILYVVLLSAVAYGIYVALFVKNRE